MRLRKRVSVFRTGKRPVDVDARPVFAELRERCVASLDLGRDIAV